MKQHKYKINEIMWLGEDYADGMKIKDIMQIYGLTKSQVIYIIRQYKFRREKKRIADTKPLIRKERERKHAYMWALVTADEKELPITPYFDTVKELSKYTGMKAATLMSAKARGTVSRYYTKEGIIKVKVIRVDAE